MQYLVFGISISVISWMVGMIGNALIQNRPCYKRLSHFNFIKSQRKNKLIGLGPFTWCVKNTFFSFLNQKLKLDRKLSLDELYELRKEMTIAEISHLIGFVFVIFFALYKAAKYGLLFGLVIMLCNVLLNLYPSLLQQYNKRRLDRLIARAEKY